MHRHNTHQNFDEIFEKSDAVSDNSWRAILFVLRYLQQRRRIGKGRAFPSEELATQMLY